MQGITLRNALIFLLLFLVFSCKKEEDTQDPVITIQLPVADNTYNVYENVPVMADVTDETKITSVVISLVSDNYTPVYIGLHLQVSSPHMLVNTQYTLDNIHLETGLYYIMISASDGTNDVRMYRPIHIIGVPKALKKIFVTTSSSTSATNMSVIDSTFISAAPYHTFPGDYVGSSASSYYQQVFMCGNYTGAFASWELQSNTTKFSIAPLISGNPYFTSFYTEDKKNYIGRYDGTIKGYNNSGDVVYSGTANVGYYVTKMMMNDGHLVASEQSKTSPSKLLVSFFTTGTAEQQTPITQDIVTFCEQDENNVFVFGNVAGQGVIQLFDRVNNNLWNPYNYALPVGSILSAVKIDPNTYLIGLSNGTIYKYQYLSSSLTVYAAGYTAIQLRYDDVENRIYIAEQNSISAIDYPSTTYLGSVTSAENIKDISLLYNR
ncbi:MAG: hypothetical protein JWP12_2026 [Bacteroidetes bacterium]|nr:hypothetical protein [Bacteroidota bacterium]